MLPFEDTKNNRKVATFVLGAKGYIQLALRSGQYRKLNVLELKQGELVKYNPLTEDIEVNLIEDELQRDATETTGYYAMFEFINGFKKALYWSKAKMERHALKYSAAYRYDKNKGKSLSYWSKDFDQMSSKTMLRQLIGKWGVMSYAMQVAIESDNAVLKEDLTTDIVMDEEEAISVPKEAEEVKMDEL